MLPFCVNYSKVLILIPALFTKIHIQQDHDGRAEDEQKGDGVDDRSAAVTHLQVQVDGQGGVRTYEKERGVEVLETHEEGHSTGAQNGRLEIGEGDVADNTKARGTKVEGRFFETTVKFA